MNDKPTINPQTLPPLTRFIYTLGQLPTSYLMSMTYEEQLVWLCNYLGTQVIPAVNQNGEAVEELQNLYELLRTYVNDYFDNLDVQEEINNKLDEMAEDGTLTTLIANYVDPIIENNFELINQTINDKFDEQDNYINDQITNQNNEITTFKNNTNTIINNMGREISAAIDSSPIPVSNTSDMTDTTKIYVLTTDGDWYYYNGANWVSGGQYQAAQIDMTTPALAQLNNNMDYLGDTGYLDKTPIYEQGNLNASTGAETSDNKVVRSEDILYGNGTYIVTPNGQRFYQFNYDSEGNFLGTGLWGATTEQEITLVSGRGIRLTVNKLDGTNFTPSECLVTVKKKTIITKLDKLTTDTVNNLYNTPVITPTFEQGGIYNTGILHPADNEIRSKNIIYGNGIYELNSYNGMIYTFNYNSSGTLTGTGAWGVKGLYKININNGNGFKVVWKLQSGDNITPSDNNLVINYMPNIEKQINDIACMFKFPNNITIASKGGLGLDCAPETIYSVKEVYLNGYDCYRVNIFKTSDGKYVISHDDDISSRAKYADGSDISSPYNISDHTLAELNLLDFGINYGTKFKGTKIMELDDCISLCSKLGLKVDIEWKPSTLLQADAEYIYSLMAKNSYPNDAWHWASSSSNQLDIYHNVCEYVPLEIYINPNNINWNLINYAKSLSDKVILGTTMTDFTDSDLITIRKMNLIINQGTAYTLQTLIDQIEKGVTEIEAQIPYPKKQLTDYALREIN